MSSLVQYVTTAYALLATIPFAVFALAWGICLAVTRNKKKAMKVAMDVTTFLLIGSVASMWNHLFNSHFGFWMIALIILIAVGLLGSYQNRMKGRIDGVKIMRIVWRIGFLCLSVMYIIFLILNMSVYFIKSA